MSEIFAEMLEDYLPEQTARGQKVKAFLVRKERDYAYLEIAGQKLEGMIDAREVEEFNEGDSFDVEVIAENKDASYLKASRRNIIQEENWCKVKEAFEAKQVINAKVLKQVNGGYIVEVLRLNAFLPNSLSGVRPEKANTFIGTNVNVLIKDIKDEKIKKVLVSAKEVKEVAEREALEKLNVGDEITVKVKEIMAFGMTVEAGTIGFIHISEISGKKVDKISKLYNVGDEIQAKVIFLDKEKELLKLSIKQLSVDPWTSADSKYSIGTVTKGTVKRIVDFGIFVEVEEGIEGLVHVSDFSWGKKVKDVTKYVKLGDEIEVKVIELDSSRRKLKFGIKQLSSNPWDEIATKNVGDVISGKVVQVKDFGIFVEILEGVDVFVHNSDFSWDRNTRKEFKIGETVELKLIQIDIEEKKLKGGIKQLTKSPWDTLVETLNVGDVLEKEITNITDFGIFIKMTDTIEGMIHISEASKDFIKKLSDKFVVGETVKAEIIEINSEKHQIKLSIRKLEIAEAKKEEKELIAKYGVTE